MEERRSATTETRPRPGPAARVMAPGWTHSDSRAVFILHLFGGGQRHRMSRPLGNSELPGATNFRPTRDNCGSNACCEPHESPRLDVRESRPTKLQFRPDQHKRPQARIFVRHEIRAGGSAGGRRWPDACIQTGCGRHNSSAWIGRFGGCGQTHGTEHSEGNRCCDQLRPFNRPEIASYPCSSRVLAANVSGRLQHRTRSAVARLAIDS